MNRQRKRFNLRKLLVFVCAGLIGASFALVTPEADAGRRGGKSGSVRQASKSNRSAAANRGGGNRRSTGGKANTGGKRPAAGKAKRP